jgi:proteasome accessory factor B
VAKFSRPPIERMMRLKQLIATEKFPNCRTMAAKLEVSSKTIQRDIDFMRDRLEMPIEYDQAEFGFYFSEQVTHFPTLDISEGEIVALFIAEKALVEHRGTVFEKPLRSACQKLADSLREEITVAWADLDAAVSFRSTGVSRGELRVFDAVSRAVLNSLEISFHYHKLGSEQLELRRGRPYHLGCVENQWYCFAHDLDREQLRTFALPRMSEVKVSRTKFQRPADFSIQRHLGESFGVFRHGGEGKLQAVRIRFDPWASRLVNERLWHESQEIKALSGGRIELRLELSGLEEIERWVLSWGEHAEVIAPRRLRERIREVGRAIALRK